VRLPFLNLFRMLTIRIHAENQHSRVVVAIAHEAKRECAINSA
jgi:hypothetical protein